MINNYNKFEPKIKESCFIADNASIIGNVDIGEDSSVWFGAVIRGDLEKIVIGRRTNIQDNCTIHVDTDCSVELGDGVTIGHNSIIHGCKIGNNCLIGMGSTILNGATIGDNCIIGANSLITQGKKIPSGVLCLGSPAKIIRELTEEEINFIKKNAEHYVELAKCY
ncbi:galactoside O-acetyltransferase [Clostridium tepidiprofundi DSM 19306]|uniref:Galactoside O-acetyltransferase n=1 Tax=Clostridium tepidiprofundi DSM 19306 TaxID=1121338 RepID=A0A151B6Q8_9CLOT|nr:gamma carbonic anhydrase family protein [Clostridium tepidiprofundi]KYH35605.1 galactoside O-acetyltransferase [Clostridium tepidiprofundi DSM 19306]